MMRRWLPYPLLSLLLALIWLVFKQQISPGTILPGAVLGIALGKVFERLRPPKARVRNYPAIARLLVRVASDIVRSNLVVARLILGGRRSGMQSGFVTVPLTLTDRHGLAVLGCIITSTPGTVWVSFDSAANVLLIHVLDLVDEATWIDNIQQRYERPLMDIFQ